MCELMTQMRKLQEYSNFLNLNSSCSQNGSSTGLPFSVQSSLLNHIASAKPSIPHSLVPYSAEIEGSDGELHLTLSFGRWFVWSNLRDHLPPLATASAALSLSRCGCTQIFFNTVMAASADWVWFRAAFTVWLFRKAYRSFLFDKNLCSNCKPVSCSSWANFFYLSCQCNALQLQIAGAEVLHLGLRYHSSHSLYLITLCYLGGSELIRWDFRANVEEMLKDWRSPW